MKRKGEHLGPADGVGGDIEGAPLAVQLDVCQTVLDGGARLDVAYQIRLRATKPAAEILTELSKLEGISDVQFMMQDATTEM